MYRSSNTYAAGEAQAQRNADGSLADVPNAIVRLVEKVQEAAGWKTGKTTLGFKTGGYEARTIEIYGYDQRRRLAVIQLRREWKKKRHWYPLVNKAYALVGLDGGRIFSHQLPSSPRRNANLPEMTPGDVVLWAESKIFGVPVDRVCTIRRQGDVALLPMRSLPRSITPVSGPVMLRDSHQITVVGTLFKTAAADIWYARGTVELLHTKNEHQPVIASGTFKIVAGQRAGSPWWLHLEIGD